jgi:hypothetical protein
MEKKKTFVHLSALALGSLSALALGCLSAPKSSKWQSFDVIGKK